MAPKLCWLENRGVTIPALDLRSGVGFQLFLGLMAILIPDPDPGKSGFITAIVMTSLDLDPELSS